MKFRLLAVALLVLAPLCPASAEPFTVTDIAGRTVTVNGPVSRIILGEGRFLPSLAILERGNPAARVVGMMGEFEQLDPSTYSQYVEKFPMIAEIPLLGKSGSSSFSVESAIAVKPDLAIFGMSSGHGPGAKSVEILAQLEAAGVPTIVIDFRMEPLINTPTSLELLGKVLGREREAKKFLDFYRHELERVESVLRTVTTRPDVFMESHVGLRDACCNAFGNAVMGRFIDFAGGHNIFGDRIPGAVGTISVEDLLVNQPDIYVGTAIGNVPVTEETGKRIVLGAKVSPEIGAASLETSTHRQGVSDLTAVREGRAYGLWHHFYNTPMSVVAVQALAKWFHPEEFAGLDPRTTLETFFERFQPFPVDGVYWTGLPQ